MSSLEKSAGSLEGWLERSSNRDNRRDLRKDEATEAAGEGPARDGDRWRIRRGGGRGISLSIAINGRHESQSRPSSFEELVDNAPLGILRGDAWWRQSATRMSTNARLLTR